MTGNDHAGVYVPPLLLFIIPLVAAALVPAPQAWPILETLSTTAALGGLLAVTTGVAMGLASVASFRGAGTTILPAGRPTTAVVDAGPYAFTRNPMYLAMAFGYAGLALLLNNMWALLLLPVVLAVVDRFVIRREERYLASKFGRPYRDYCLRTRRWI
ncbi:MAG: isoprenylcysteine carboxylmethyltransferase family protein [Vicinamibacterales bacterium]